MIFSVFALCGCANIEYQRITDDTGKILDKLVVELDEKEILAKMSPEKLSSLKNDILKDAENYIQTINYLKLQLQIKNPTMDFRSGITTNVPAWIYYEENVSRLTIEVMYENVDYLKQLNGDPEENEENDDNTEIVSNLFISKYMMYSDNVFMGMESMANGSYFEYYSSKYDEFKVEDLNLTQVYGTTDYRLKSNADYRTRIDGINYHLWEIDSQNEGYKSMKLNYYYTTAVGTGWYIVAVSMSIALAIVLILVYIIKNFKNKKYKQKVVLEDYIVDRLDKDE